MRRPGGTSGHAAALQQRIELVENLPDPGTLGFMKALERLGHHVLADARQRERALDALDDGGAVPPDAIQPFTDAHHHGLQFAHPREIAGARRFEHRDVKPREEIRATAHAAVCARDHRIGEHLLRADEHGPVRTM